MSLRVDHPEGRLRRVKATIEPVVFGKSRVGGVDGEVRLRITEVKLWRLSVLIVPSQEL